MDVGAGMVLLDVTEEVRVDDEILPRGGEDG